MPVINAKDLEIGEQSFEECCTAMKNTATVDRTMLIPENISRDTLAMAVRYSLFLLEHRAPGDGVEIRVAPWGAVKILEGPRSDPHNLTPPDVIELEPWVWLRLACGMTNWDEEKEAGHIAAVGERDNLSALLPLVAEATGR